MIFSGDRCRQVLCGAKTATWRPAKDWDVPVHDADTDEIVCVERQGRVLWRVGGTYAVQPGRGKLGLGRIRMLSICERCPYDIDVAGLRAEGFRGGRFDMQGEFRAVLEEMYPSQGDVMYMYGYSIEFEAVQERRS